MREQLEKPHKASDVAYQLQVIENTPKSVIRIMDGEYILAAI